MLSVAKLTESSFVSASDDKTLRIWEVENPNSVQTFKGQADFVSVTKMSETSFVSASGGGVLNLWDMDSITRIGDLKKTSKPFTNISFFIFVCLFAVSVYGYFRISSAFP